MQSVLRPFPPRRRKLLDAYEEDGGRYDGQAGRPTSEPDNSRQAVRRLCELYANIDARDFGPLALKAVRQAIIERDCWRTSFNRQM